MEIKKCSVCGFVSTSSLRFKIGVTKDNKEVCTYCYKSWSKNLQKKYKKMQLSEIKATLEKEEYHYPDYFPSFEVDGLVQFDDRHKLWKELSGATANRTALSAITAMIPMVPLSYEDVVKVELFETGNSRKSKEISVKITQREEGVLKYYKIVIADAEKVRKSSSTYEWYLELANSVIDAFQQRISKERDFVETLNFADSSVVSVADELLKYKELFDAGLMTKAEFEVQKEKILSFSEKKEMIEEVFSCELKKNDMQVVQREEVNIENEIVQKEKKQIPTFGTTEQIFVHETFGIENRIKEEIVIMDENDELVICPKCGSHNIKKITKANKAISIAVFSVFAAGKALHTWHCNDCKKEW